LLVKRAKSFSEQIRLRTLIASLKGGFRGFCTSLSTEEEASGPKPLYLRAYDEYCEGRTEEALNLLDQVEPSDAHHSLALALRGRVATMQGDYQKALDYFKKSLEENDANSLTYYYKASVHDLLKETNEAIQCLYECLDVEPEFALARAELAGLLIRLGDYQTAIEHCDYCLASYPDMEQAQYWKAKALFNMARYQEAKIVLAKWDEYGDTYAIRLGALAGEVELALGNVAHAKKLFLKARKENKAGFPDDALCKLAKIYVDEGKATEASNLLRSRLLEEDEAGQQSELLYLIQKCYGSVLYHCGDVENAIGSYQFSLKLNDKQLEVHLEVIRLQTETNRFEEALESVKKAEAVFPTDTGIQKLKLTTLLNLGLIDEALKVIDVLEAAEGSTAGWLSPFRCLVLCLGERRSEAEALYHQIKINITSDPIYVINLAKAAFLLEKYEASSLILKSILNMPNLPESALSMAAHLSLSTFQDDLLSGHLLTELVKRYPSHVLYLSQLAQLKQKLGEDRFAVTIWTHITKLCPHDARAWNAIGDIYSGQQRHLEALTQFKRAQECEGPDEAVQEAITKEGMTLLCLQRWNQAIDKLEAATQGPQYSDLALRVLGSILAGEFEVLFGIPIPPEYVDLEQAVNVLKAAVSDRVMGKIDPAAVHFLLARTLMKLNRKDEATSHLKTGIAIDPQSPEIPSTEKIVMEQAPLP
jgi:tetratricopeptide (TPR) repeat protein